MSLEIVAVDSGRRLSQFLALPEQVYPPDSRWVAPPRLLIRFLMGGLKRPDRGFWLALDDGKPVARLGAYRHIDAVHFGFFECLPGWSRVCPPLFERARQLAPGLPLRGPYQFLMEDPYTGLLVQGMEEDPMLACSYNPPYYADYLADVGLEPLMDLNCYSVEGEALHLDRMAGRARRARERGVTVRTLNPARRHQELAALFTLVNQTHAENWGFERYTATQMREMTWLSYVFLDHRGVFLAEVEGRLVGCAVVLQNLNPILKPARGRITLRLLWDYLTRRHLLDTYRGYGLGVLKEFRDRDVAGALVQAVAQRRHRYPTRQIELSWIVASNVPMNALARALGGRLTRVYRVFGTDIPREGRGGRLDP